MTQESTSGGSAPTVSQSEIAASYRSALPVSPPTIAMLTRLISRHRRVIGSRWRKVSAAEQAVLVLAMLRHDQRLLDLSRANAVSASTIRRWLLEVIGLLAARAPRLDRVLRRLVARGAVVVLADGTLL
ncbi:hypothetical protein ACFWY9_19915, partial [Amycolatopsis sp. NPDC059027]